MNFDKWLDKQTKKYKLHISTLERSSDFNHYQYSVVDPSNRALNFTIFLNEHRDPTLFTTDVFPLEYFNIAEHYTSDQILEAAMMCLDGRVSIKRSLTGGFIVDFGFVEGKSESDVVITPDIIRGIEEGFSEKDK